MFQNALVWFGGVIKCFQMICDVFGMLETELFGDILQRKTPAKNPCNAPAMPMQIHKCMST
jgi:hypothetical protein